MRISTRAALALACAAAVAGCGGGGGDKITTTTSRATYQDFQAIGRVVRRLGEASRRRDGATICEELFTRDLSISVARASHASCPAAIARHIFSRKASFQVKRIVTRTAAFASVEVVDQKGRPSTLLMQKQRGAWRIARIG